MSKCLVHRIHIPTPLLIEVHHIQPLAMEGPNHPENEVLICTSGHYNVHTLLADLIRTGTMRNAGTKKERSLARQGYNEWVAAGKPGHPVYV